MLELVSGAISRSWPVLITKWHTKTLQQRVALRIVGRGSDDCDLQTSNFIYLVVIDLWKDDLLAQAQAIVATAVE